MTCMIPVADSFGLKGERAAAKTPPLSHFRRVVRVGRSGVPTMEEAKEGEGESAAQIVDDCLFCLHRSSSSSSRGCVRRRGRGSWVVGDPSVPLPPRVVPLRVRCPCITATIRRHYAAHSLRIASPHALQIEREQRFPRKCKKERDKKTGSVADAVSEMHFFCRVPTPLT